MLYWYQWLEVDSLKAKYLRGELAIGLSGTLNTVLPGASQKGNKEFEYFVTDREKRSQNMGSCTAIPLEQVTVKLKGF